MVVWKALMKAVWWASLMAARWVSEEVEMKVVMMVSWRVDL